MEPDTTSLTDSAGVAIQVSPDTMGVAYVIGAPSLSLGGVDATGPEQFGSVEAVAWADDGSIWVSDRQTQDVRVFNADGTWRTTVGGRGDGPGEFRGIQLLGAADGDSVAVVNASRRRVSWFSLDGELLSESAIVMPDGRVTVLHGVLRDGSLVGTANTPISSLTDGEVFGAESNVVVWLSPGTEPKHLATQPSRANVIVGNFPDFENFSVPFTNGTSPGFGASVVLGSGSAFELRVFGKSGLRRIVRLQRPPQPVTADLERQYRGRAREGFAAESYDDVVSMLDHPLVPEFTPAYTDILVGSSGELWARRWGVSGPGDWDVFDPEGDYMGRVVNPDGVRVEAVGQSEVLGWSMDDLGIPYVRRYQLSRP